MSFSLPLSRSGRSADEIATKIIHQAGDVLRTTFRQGVRVDVKGRGNLVTEIDTRVEQEALNTLNQEYPAFGLLAEESGAAKKGKENYTWVLDPLDGTRNFATGVPFFSVTLALLKGQDIVLGFTYDPLRDELFRAARGEGTTINGKPARVTQLRLVSEGSLGLDIPYVDQLALEALEVVQTLWPVQTVRIMGSAALGMAYVAAGWIDLYFHHYLAPWDIAAGILLVQEAGGDVTDREGNPVSVYSQDIVASSPLLVQDFLTRTADLPWRLHSSPTT